MNKLKLSGTLYFIEDSLILMGVITTETLYHSSYSTLKSEISDLGATKYHYKTLNKLKYCNFISLKLFN